MMHETIEAPAAEAGTIKFRMEAKPLAKALALLAAQAMGQPRYSRMPAVLSYILVDVDENGTATLTATNLNSFISLQLAADVEQPGRFCVPAAPLRDGVKKIAKESGAWIDFSEEAGKLQLASGRTRLSYPLGPVDEFPPVADARRGDDGGPIPPSEQWTVEAGSAVEMIACCRREGLKLGDDALKLLGKFVKYAGAVELAASRFDIADDYKPCRYVVGAPGATFGGYPAEPAFVYRWRPQRSRFTFNVGGDCCARARDYLNGLRERYRLPAAPDGSEGQLQYRDGLALGMTFGEGFWDQSGYRPDETPEGWTPPEGTAVEDGVCFVDGVEYHDMKARNGPGFPMQWVIYYRAEREHSFVYPEGSYSIAMPRGSDRCIAADYVEVDGGANVPLGFASSGAINLNAEQVRELCGPVDESTFVEIKPYPMHHGRRLPEGFRPPEPLLVYERNDKGRLKARKMTDREVTRAYEADRAGTIAALQPKPTPEAELAVEAIVELAQALRGWHADVGSDECEQPSAAIIPFPAELRSAQIAEERAAEPPSAGIEDDAQRQTEPAPEASQTPVEEREEKTAPSHQPLPAFSCAPDAAQPEGHAEPPADPVSALIADLQARVAALEAAANSSGTQPEGNSGAAPAARLSHYNNLQRARRLRIVRAYLRLRREREALRSAIDGHRQLLLESTRREHRERERRRFLAARAVEMRQRRARDAGALVAGNDYCRKVEAERDALGEKLRGFEMRAEDAEFKAADLGKRVEELSAQLAVETARADSADGRWAIALDEKQARIVALENELIERMSGGKIKLTTPLRANAAPAWPASIHGRA